MITTENTEGTEKVLAGVILPLSVFSVPSVVKALYEL